MAGLKDEAPRYVQLLPELPRLLHQALQPKPAAQAQMLEALLAEQRQTNRPLRGLIYATVGFVLGALMWAVLVPLWAQWHP